MLSCQSKKTVGTLGWNIIASIEKCASDFFRYEGEIGGHFDWMGIIPHEFVPCDYKSFVCIVAFEKCNFKGKA